MINKKFIFPVGGSDLKYAILGEKRVKMTKIPYYISNEGEYTPVLCWIRDQNAGREIIVSGRRKWYEMCHFGPKTSQFWRKFDILGFTLQKKESKPLYCFKTTTRMQGEVWLVENSYFRLVEVL